MEVHPLRVRRFLHVSHDTLGSRLLRVHEQGDLTGLGNQLRQQLEALGRQLDGDDADAREVALRPGEACDETGPDRIADEEDDRDRRGCPFCGARRDSALGRDHVDLTADEVSDQRGQSIVASFCPAVFDRQIVSLYVAVLPQALAERRHIRTWAGRGGAEETNNRHRLLLRAGGERPCNLPAEKNNEIAPVQSFTLSWAIDPTNLSHRTFSYQGSAKIAGGVGPSMTGC